MDKNGNKTGGRQAGTPNKKLQFLHDKAEELGVCPVTMALLMVRGDRRDLGYEDVIEAKRRVYEEDRAAYEFEPPKKGQVKQPFPEFPEYTDNQVKQMNLLSLEERREALGLVMPYMYSKLRTTEHKIDDEDKQTFEQYLQGLGNK